MELADNDNWHELQDMRPDESVLGFEAHSKSMEESILTIRDHEAYVNILTAVLYIFVSVLYFPQKSWRILPPPRNGRR